jgi:AbrB family looped-hinge helix DNA binding protein
MKARPPDQRLYYDSKGVPRISSKNQVTLPVAVLDDAHLQAGDPVVIEARADGEIVIRRGAVELGSAFGALTGVFPAGYLQRLDAEEERR